MAVNCGGHLLPDQQGGDLLLRWDVFARFCLLQGIPNEHSKLLNLRAREQLPYPGQREDTRVQRSKVLAQTYLNVSWVSPLAKGIVTCAFLVVLHILIIYNNEKLNNYNNLSYWKVTEWQISLFLAKYHPLPATRNADATWWLRVWCYMIAKNQMLHDGWESDATWWLTVRCYMMSESQMLQMLHDSWESDATW